MSVKKRGTLMLKQFLIDEEGASMAEYALLLGLITVSIITVITAFGTKLSGAFTTATTNIPN